MCFRYVKLEGPWTRWCTRMQIYMTDQHLQVCLNNGIAPSWMIKGRTVLIMKDSKKDRFVSNYRPIACLPVMWKLLTEIIGDETYNHLEKSSLLHQVKSLYNTKYSQGTRCLHYYSLLLSYRYLLIMDIYFRKRPLLIIFHSRMT